MKWLSDILISYKKFVFFSTSAGIVLMIFFLPFPSFTGSLNGFELDDNVRFQETNQLDSLFENKNKVYLKLTQNADNRNEVFNTIRIIKEDIKAVLPGTEIVSPDVFYHTMIRHWTKRDSSLSTFLHEGREVPILQQLIAKDEGSFLMVLTVNELDESVVPKLDSILNIRYQGIEQIEIFSTVHLESDIKKHIGKDILLISALILLFLLGILLLLFRNILAVLFTLALGLLTVIVSLLLFNVFGYTITIISILVIPITLILSMSDSLHLMSVYIKNKTVINKDVRIEKVLSHVIVPSFFSSLTTAAAFFTFYLFNDSRYIQEFGLITSLSLMLEFVLTFAIAPFLLYHFNLKTYYDKQLNQVSSFFLRTKKVFAFGFMLILVASIFYVGELKFHSNTEMFFPANSDIQRVHESFKQNYYSSIDLNIYIKPKTNSPQEEMDNELYTYTKELTNTLKKQNLIVHVNSATEQFYFKSNMGLRVNLFDYLNDENPYYNPERNIYKIQVQFAESQDVIKFKENYLGALLNNTPGNIEVNYSSTALLMEAVNESVSRSLIQSLTSSGIVIFLMMLLLSGSLKIAFYALFPNIVPIAFVIVYYAVFGLHINILTAITAVVCIGLLDDDTVHILYRTLWLKEEMEELSFSILSSATLLSVGFLLFMFSSFEPIRIFGWVSASIFIIGVVCEMTIMQWVLQKAKK